MGKKKRQNDPHKDDSTTESCDEKQANSSQIINISSEECKHIIKSVDPIRLRKVLKGGRLESDCSECNKSPSLLDGGRDDDLYECDPALWLCLKCGSQLCGRSKSQHALTHFKTPRSDSHAMALNTTTFKIWCYSCDDEINPILQKRLTECIEYVKKLTQQSSPPPQLSNNIQGQTILNDNKKSSSEEFIDMLKDMKQTAKPLVDNSQPKNYQLMAGLTPDSGMLIPGMARRIQTINSLPRLRGLTNLGNTCFFNAVLQCLAQTPFLLEVLREASEPGEEFVLPGGNFVSKDDTEILLPPIKGNLSAWRPLTAALAESLEELQTEGSVYSPGKLFQKLTTKCPQFRGGDQHDSHELLRHLLESVRTDDLQRYQRLILSSLGYNNEDINSVKDEMKQKCKFYGEQVSDRILRPEQVFRGFLVSTLTCQVCFNTSSRHENFLDLSLPVSIEKPQPPARRKTSPEPYQPPGPSKHQLKKEKEKERKAKRMKKHQNKRIAANQSIDKDNENNSNSRTDSSASEESDADVEDNATDETPKLSENFQSINRTIPPLYDTNGNSEIHSPINPEKYGDSPENPNKDLNEDENDSGIATSPANTLMSDQGACVARGGFMQEKVLNDSSSKAGNLVLKLGISEEGASLIRQRSQTSDNDGPPTRQMDQLDLNEKGSKHKVRSKQRVRTQSHSDWSNTLGPRYQCDDGECSIQSCLNSFTAVEFMTGNNKVGCEACTKSVNGENGKTINTNATKQFLISSPPAVLILHLKRFQVGPRFMFRKMTRHVSFPMVLDIAPFCGSKIKQLPNVDRSQKRLLYALYGVVEHSGSMHGGHYTAYVKVRPKLTSDDPRYKFLPQGSKTELDQTDEQRAKLDELLCKERAKVLEMRMKENDSDDFTNSDTSSDCENNDEEETEGAVGGTDEPDIIAPPGKWYYVSDSFVREATEQNVLDSQAYLLFYERMY